MGPAVGVAYLDIVVHGAGLAVGGGQLRGLEVLSAAGLAARRPTRPCTVNTVHTLPWLVQIETRTIKRFLYNRCKIAFTVV